MIFEKTKLQTLSIIENCGIIFWQKSFVFIQRVELKGSRFRGSAVDALIL